MESFDFQENYKREHQEEEALEVFSKDLDSFRKMQNDVEELEKKANRSKNKEKKEAATDVRECFDFLVSGLLDYVKSANSHDLYSKMSGSEVSQQSKDSLLGLSQDRVVSHNNLINDLNNLKLALRR